MCKETTPSPQAQTSRQETTPLDREIQRANLEVQLATLRSNAEYNASPAGQMQRQFETYQRIAKPLADSNFVPAAYKGNVGDCIIAVEMSARLGVFPLTVMQNLCIVKGNPTWKSRFLIGCVNTCGRYTTLDYHIAIDGTVGDIKAKTWERGADGKNHEILKPFDRPQLDNLSCVAFCTEKTTGKILTSPAVSVRMAIQEGWYTKDGSKWPTMTELMLRYRAASMWVSTYAPEISMGFRTEEEQRDILDIPYEDMGSESPAAIRPSGSERSEDSDRAAGLSEVKEFPAGVRPGSNMEEAKEKLRARTNKKNTTTNPINEMP